MKISVSALSALLLASSSAASPTELEELYPHLGRNSLEVYDYSYGVKVDKKTCDYTFEVKFEHVEAFDIGSAETCVPGVFTEYNPAVPFLGTFFFYEEFPDYITEATGFDHLSLDYNPCGHPSGGWLSAHYDMHFYRVTPAYRATEMDCRPFGPVPILCDFTAPQESDSGLKYFETNYSDDGVTPINMPAGFEYGFQDAVVNMGTHAFDFSDVPADPRAWTEPSLIYGTHGDVIFFEPMLPFQFVEGDENHSYSRTIEYVEQTIPTLPYNLSVVYNKGNGVTTVTFKGKSNLCAKEFKDAEKAFRKSNKD